MKMSAGTQWSLRQLSRLNVALYRLTGGLIGGRLAGSPVLLLTTIGRRSGRSRPVPARYLREPEALVVVASKGGTDEHPLWFNNLESNPEVTVEVRRERRQVRARVASDAEHDVLWPKVVAMYRGYASYQRRTTRKIPLVILD